MQSEVGRGSTFGFTMDLEHSRREEPFLRLLNPHYLKRVNQIRLLNETDSRFERDPCELSHLSDHSHEDYR